MSAVVTEPNPQSAIRSPQSQKLRIVIVGHVDHGKSTLIGRLFHDTNSLPEGKVEQIRKASEAEGMEFEFAFLLDALLEEQAQNITIDTTQLPFRTAKREYVIIDAPGHKEFPANRMVFSENADFHLIKLHGSATWYQAGPDGEAFRRTLSPQAKLVHTFEAESNHEAMTIYYEYNGWGQYKLDHVADRQPYPEAWGERQRRGY